jgi:NAD-dependent dihydropyrimidine dehydrogenase PreA subunit
MRRLPRRFLSNPTPLAQCPRFTGAHSCVILITASPLERSYTDFERTGSTHFILEIEFIMAYVITDSCIKDSLCVEVCPTDCIHPKQDEPGFEAATQMYVEPDGCIDCGACVPVCTSDSIHALDDVPEDKKDFIEKNAAYYAH